jgi:predicted nucleic acid-binding protein
MTVKTFVDSNILLYAHDLDAGDRHRRAAACLAALWGAGGGLISTQVLQEFYVNVTRKIRSPLPAATAREVVRAYAPWVQTWITADTIVRASEIGEIWQLSFWDSLILAAAEQSEAVELLTEDLNHGQVIAGIRVVNPFLPGAPARVTP